MLLLLLLLCVCAFVLVLLRSNGSVVLCSLVTVIVIVTK